MTRRRRWTLVVALAVLVGGPLALLTSESALRFVAGIVSQRIAALEIDNIRGRLLTGVTADRVTWRDDARATVTVVGFSTGWRMLPALAGRLHLDRVDATSVTVALPPAQPAPADAGPREIRLPAQIRIPLVIRIREMSVGVVTVLRGGDTLVEVEAVDASDVYWDPDTFRAGRLSGVGDPVSFDVSGTVQPAGAWPMDITARWRAVLPGRPRFDGTLAVAGALDRTLEVNAEAGAADAGAARFAGTLRNLLRAPGLQGRLIVTDALLQRWHDAAPDAQVSGDVVLDGWLQDLVVVGSAAVATPDWPRAELDAELHWGRRLLAVRRAAVRSPEVGTTVDASGHFDWSAEHASGNLRADWQALRWPLDDADGLRSDTGRLDLEYGDRAATARVDAHFGESADGAVRARADLSWIDDEATPRIDVTAEWEQMLLAGVGSDHGRASAQGTPDDWAGALVAAVAPPGVPMMTLSADATGDRESLRATEVHADWLGGTARGTFELGWAERWHAAADLQLQRVNPGLLLPDWDGRLGGRLQATLAVGNGVAQWRARLHDAAGDIGGRTFSAHADVQGAGARLRAVDAAAQVGDAEATVRGRLQPEVEVAWRISAPDLGALVPGAAGTFRGEGFLRGDPDAPAFTFDVAGANLEYRRLTLARLSGDGDVDLAGTRGARAIVRVEALDVHGREVDAVELSLSGPRDALTIGVNARVNEADVSARMSGAWADDRFDGRLDVAGLVYDDEAPWQLGTPVHVRFGAGTVHLEEACWRQRDTPNELCVAADWQEGGDTRARVALTGLPLAELSAWLPLGFQYSGRIGGDASLVWPAGGEPEAEGRLSIINGAWQHLVGDETVALLQWTEASVVGRLGAGNVDVTAGFELVDGGHLRASVDLPVFDTAAGAAGQRPLRAEVAGTFSDFDLIPAFVPDIGSVTGNVRADLTVAGTLAAPLFAGSVVIDDGTTTIPRLGVRLTGLGFTVDGNRDELGLRGRARSGDGTLEADGRFAVRDGRVGGEMRIRGEDFEAARIPEARVHIAPDLTVRVAGRSVDVDGEVRVPYARLSPRDLSGTIDVSEDEILVDEEEVFGDDEQWRISARVRISMGDVEFSGFGLDGKVTGSLTAIDAPEQLTRATGELQVQDGRYRAWGQTLDIEYGRLIFTGGPIAEPGVDVLAVRKPQQDVTVGVNVRGTLREPELRLYSDPAMTQSEQLSWLVLGTPLTRATGSEQALLDRTRDTAGLAGGDFVARELGRRLGLSDVAIDRGDNPEEAALVIGHYLSPRLYIGYGIGIFDPENSLRFRYHIDRHWSIEAETGERATSSDLRFTIER